MKKTDMNKSPQDYEKEIAGLKEQADYYRLIAAKSGQKRLQEIDHLNRLIAEIRRTEESLRYSEERFRLIAQSTNDIFYEWNVADNHLIWHGDIDSALGYEKGELEPTVDEWLRIIHPEDRASMRASVTRRQKAARVSRYSYRVIRKDGSIRYWRDVSTPILDGNGYPTLRFGGISDVTQQKRAEEAVIQTQRLSAIGELASGVAHDFNNSLQGIVGNIELLLLKDLPPELKEPLLTIKKSAIDATARVRQLQRCAGSGAGAESIEQQDLNKIIEDVVLQTRPFWKDESEKHGIAVEIVRDYADKELLIDGNAGELRSVVYNIIKNSLYAMPHGGRIVCKTQETGKGLIASISDSGTGMDGYTRARVFQPFFSTKGSEKGRGLGMSTAYAIIKDHGGDIYIKETVPGEGTTVEILLPPSSKIHTLSEGTLKEYEGSASVLWVDDDELIRKMGKRFLEIINCKADVAKSGEEALYYIQNNFYDIIITDISMPNMNGWQLIERIRSEHPEISIGAVTGWGTDAIIHKKDSLSVDFIIGKPIELEQLRRVIGDLLDSKKSLKSSGSPE